MKVFSRGLKVIHIPQNTVLFTIAFLVCFGCVPPSAPADQHQTPTRTEPLVNVYHQPVPFTSGGKTLLTYELWLSNLSFEDMVLDSIAIVDISKDRDTPLKTYSGFLLNRCSARLMKRQKHSEVRLVAGWTMVVFLQLEFEDRADVPDTLQHRIDFTTIERKRWLFLFGCDGGRTPASIRIETAVAQEEPVIIGPPLRDGLWMVYGCPGEEGFLRHRGSHRPHAGRPVDRARYAIDFIGVNEQGREHEGPPDLNSSWFGYGADVIACAEGTVVAVHDGIPENRGPARAVPMNSYENIAGNFVILDIGSGRYAHYAHLKTGGICVRQGERVTTGQLLGQLGNSGNSTAPHLHFHICDSDDLIGEGLPFVFHEYEYLGGGEAADPVLRAFERMGVSPPVPAVTPGIRRNEVPGERFIIRFFR